MRKAILGKTGFEISRVTYGGIICMDETQADSDRFVATAVEHGVNYFDVAPSYGNSEQHLGPSLEPYRKNVYLACKTNRWAAADAKEDLLNSLKTLRTDYFDVYQLHGMTTDEDIERVVGPGGAMEALVWAKKEGLVRNLGVTTHSDDCALRCLDLFDFDTVLFPMNWSLGLNRGWGDRISERVRRENIGLLAMKTLIHRTWRSEEERKIYPKSWCKPVFENDALAVAGMKYGIFKGAVTLIPPGNFERFSFALEHIDEVIDEPLSDGEWELLRREAEAVKGEMIF